MYDVFLQITIKSNPEPIFEMILSYNFWHMVLKWIISCPRKSSIAVFRLFLSIKILHFIILNSAKTAAISLSALISARRVPWMYSTHRIASEINPIPTIATVINEISTAYFVIVPRSRPAARHMRLTRKTKCPYFTKLKYKSRPGQTLPVPHFTYL